jgi:Fe/S biogenesis protein NfuA
MDEEIREKVQTLLENAINPAIAGHGGFVDLLDVKDNVVYLAMGGGCQGCGMADVTLRHGIEALLRDEIPEIAEIVDATDHAAGDNPYYTPARSCQAVGGTDVGNDLKDRLYLDRFRDVPVHARC